MVSWLRGEGIEIGALHNPLALPEGASVRYVDRMREEDLRRHYPELAGVPLAPVTVLGDAQDLSAFGDGSLDFVVANHLLEHLEDPVRGLVEMQRVLRDGGVLYVALPDPRATFDRNRQVTDVEHLLKEYREGTAATRRAHFEEWVDVVEPLLTDWEHVLTGRDLDREGQVRLLIDLDWSIHFHVWRPESFLEFLSAARKATGLQFELLAFEPCIAGQDDEFILVLRKGSFDEPPPAPPSPQVEALPPAPSATPPVEPVSDAGPSDPSKRRRLALWLHGDGIELGALHKPLPVPADARVRYVDRLSVPDLRRHYPELADLDLVPVAHIGSAEDLSAISDSSLDFVIGCHVVEHLEDPTRGLNEIYRVLRDGGFFYCALPEPRVSFDRWRELTSVEHLLDEHPAGRASRRDHFVDWVENVERHQDWWIAEQPDVPTRIEMLMDMDYSIHYHVWRPDTFLEYLLSVRRRGGPEFEPVAFAPCEPGHDDEFIFILRKGIAATPVTPPAVAAVGGSHRPQRRTEAMRLARRAASEFRSGGALHVSRLIVRRAQRWLNPPDR